MAERTLPPDVNSETLSRLSPLKRENLSEESRAALDAALNRPKTGKNLAGLQGPGGVWIRMPKFGKLMGEANRYLRSDIDLSPALIEVTILAAAREMSSQFEWTMHEPVAAKEGVPQGLIDAIKHRKPLQGVPDREAAIIQLAREAIGAKKVSSETYAKALKQFGEDGLLQVVALMSSYASTAIVLSVFDQQLHDGQSPMLPQG